MSFDKEMITPAKLKELRDQLGYSNQQMADLLGISSQTWLNKISASSNSGKISKLEFEFLLLLAGSHPDYKIEKVNEKTFSIEKSIELATSYRKEYGYVGKAGVVIVYKDEVQGWCNELRDPQQWVAGCFAIDEQGNYWTSIAGNDYDGALMWLPMKEV